MRIGLVAAALALLLLVTGCGAADPAVRLSRGVTPPVATSPAQATGLRLSYADLVAALPPARDLYPWTVTVRCLTSKAECGHFLDGKGAVLIGAGARSQEVRERLMLGVLRWPSAQAATAAVDKLRRGTARDTGEFDRAAEPRKGGGYVMGAVGHGETADLTVSGWAGYRHLARYRLVHLGGRRTRVGHWCPWSSCATVTARTSRSAASDPVATQLGRPSSD